MIRLFRGLVLKIVYPLTVLMGLACKRYQRRLQLLIVHLNNWLVLRSHLKPRTVMLLLPHCLQTTVCEVRITHQANKCKMCGRCPIGDLLKLAQELKMSLVVATGGTLARRAIETSRPEAVIAVACERDLCSGIVDSFPLPVLGVINQQPCGPCVNTEVDLGEVKKAVAALS